MKKFASILLSMLMATGAIAAASAETYTGTAQGIGEVSVTLTVEDGKITAAEVVGENETKGIGYEPCADGTYADAIVAAQGVDFDSISGATVTSNAVKDATKKAMAAAGLIEAEDTTVADAECDVVIVGAGGAGMWAAVEAVRAGKSVVVIEKGGNVGVANGSLAGGPFMVGSKLQQEAGVEFTVEEAFNHIMEYAHWSTNAAAVKAAVVISGETVDQFTDDFGVPTGLRPDNYGAGHASVRANFQSDPKDSKTQAKGEDRMKPLQEFVESKGGEFLFNTAGKRLIMEDGACTGVQCEGDGVTDVKAKAVIVATGGFSCNQEMVSTYLPSQARLGPLTVNSMGEGHQLCKAIGGVYTHMDMEANRMSDLAQVTVWGYFSPQVQVTPQGRRFIKEDQSHDSPDKAVELGLGFWWTIFDDQAINSSQKWNVEMNMKSNADRLVGPCNSLDELAAAMDVPADTLKATFETYDAMVAAGEDTEFGKKLFLQSLSAPYYAMKHFPYRYKTHGGMKITTDSQLTDKDGNPIPNVYCAGSTVADSGSDLSPNAGSGLISGKAVVEALKA